MSDISGKKGFTLAELALVMVIIGLLIAGVLKSQEMLESSRITATMAQAKAFQAAAMQFRSIYGFLPGDFPDAAFKLTGCNENCADVRQGISNGDGSLGVKDDDNSTIWMILDPTFHNPIRSVTDEKYLFWLHLYKAGLITGVTDQGMYEETPATVGITNPSAKIGGVFTAGTHRNNTRASLLGWTLDEGEPTFTAVTLVSNLESTPLANSNEWLPLTPLRAAQIDRKMDDGYPATGSVSGFSDPTTVVMGGGMDDPILGAKSNCARFDIDSRVNVYNETSPFKSCGMVFMLTRD